MAWTNVKDECLPRVARVARLLGVSDREVLGTLTLLWRNSQDRLAVEGTRENLIDWMHLEGEDDATIARWFAALARAPFISALEDDRFRIHGNEVEVARAEERHAIAQKGAKARWAKAKNVHKMPEACSEHAASMPAATPIQGNALQGNSNEEEGAAASRPPSSPPPPEKISKPDPIQTEADTAVLDPARVTETILSNAKPEPGKIVSITEPADAIPIACPVRRGWLTRLGFTPDAVASWLRDYGEAKVLCGLGEAYSDERADPDGFRAPPPGQSPRPEKLRLAQKLRRYIANADPPPVGAVIPLSEPKAGAVKREFCGECVNGWVSEIRFAGDAGVSRPCECTTEKLCEGGS